jgi:stage V sporulation protein K
MSLNKASKNGKGIEEDKPLNFEVDDLVRECVDKLPAISQKSRILKAKVLVVCDNGDLILKIIESANDYYNGHTVRYFEPERLEAYSENETEAKSSTKVSGKIFKYNATPEPEPEAKPKVVDYDNLESLKELNSLIGLGNVKRQVEEMVANFRIAKLREEHGLKSDKQSLHMILKGSSGTGKTTVARIIGKLMAEIGALKRPKGSKEVPFIEIIHTDVTGKFVGEAEKAVAKKFEEARGGVLFLDEVYSFAGADMGTGNDEVKGNMVTTLVKLMEEMKDEVIVIGAGYSKEVDKFIAANTGLSSRFPNKILFEDYSVEENVQIAEYFCKDKDYAMTPDYIEVLKKVVQQEMTKDNFGNARTVRNIIEKSIRKQSNRIINMEDKSSITKETLITLTADDIECVEEAVKIKKAIGFLA